MYINHLRKLFKASVGKITRHELGMKIVRVQTNPLPLHKFQSEYLLQFYVDIPEVSHATKL